MCLNTRNPTSNSLDVFAQSFPASYILVNGFLIRFERFKFYLKGRRTKTKSQQEMKDGLGPAAYKDYPGKGFMVGKKCKNSTTGRKRGGFLLLSKKGSLTLNSKA